MNKKSLIKYYHGEEKGFMHYVIYDRDIVVLSELDTKKVKYINENGNLNVTFNTDSKDFDLIDVKVITDKEYIGKVYNYMIETNNAYFFDGYEKLCVIKFDKK
jgi:general stress protein 26